MPNEAYPGRQDAAPFLDNPQLQDNIKAISERFINHFYQHDWRWCLPYCDQSVEYLGSTIGGYAKGCDDLRELMSSTLSRYSPSLPIIGDVGVRILPGNSTALVTMQYHLVADPLSEKIVTHRKRGTLLWLVGSEGPRLLHLHLSIPVASDVDDETLPEFSHQAFVYAKSLLERLITLPNVTLRDCDGNIQSFSPVEVRYVEASGRRTIIHTLNHDIIVREKFSRILSQMGAGIVPVHRSFAVNLSCIRTVRTDGVILDDQTFIPIPQRRSHEVRTQIEQSLRAMKPQFQGLNDRLQKLS